VAVIRWGTMGNQETLVATLADVVERVQLAGIKPPAIIVVGEVVALRKELRWFDNRPLFGRGILITRSADQAGEFGAMLERHGAHVIEAPTIEIVPPKDYSELDVAIAELATYQWLVLTSVNAVDFFFARLAVFGLDSRALGTCRVCAVGPKTAAAIRVHGITPDLIPQDYKAEGVVAAFAKVGLAGQRVLFPRADKARDVIPEGLSLLGASVVAPVAYCNVVPERLAEAALAALEERRIACITFTASSTVDNFVALLGPERLSALLEGVAVAAIGPITAASCRRLGLDVHIEPQKFTLADMTAAIVHYFQVQDEASGVLPCR
jgi:uroporphyrinogen III methyltransferase/synthase